jgi:hypothetical protein
MALILRIDVDRPYGKRGIVRHVASRLASDFYLPRMSRLGYLHDLATILKMLNSRGKTAYVFFRKCTYPTAQIRELMQEGGHQFGLHLENSGSEETFQKELCFLEQRLGQRITGFSKHGSGRMRLGLHHYPPYEPERYLPWAKNAGLKYFFGNLENPEIEQQHDGEFVTFPSAFWLEPSWRHVSRFPIEWLLREAAHRDIVLLLHPDNVTASVTIMREFLLVIDHLDTAFVPS